jgi:glyoxylase-like metal-dependent hydrolase (beta-lactamase superfamily II)
MIRILRSALAAALLAINAFAGVPVEVVPGVHLLRGAFVPGSQPDGNTVIAEGPDGLVVVDTGRHAEHVEALLRFAKSRGLPIAAVVNTHWHLDHIGGNAAVRAAHPAVRVYASGALAEARAGFLAAYRKQLAAMIASTTDDTQRAAFEKEAARIDGAAALAPDVVLESAGLRALGGRPFRVGLEEHAVTAGDVWLLDETRGVLIAGDLVTLPAPFLDTACPARWNQALARLAALDFDVIVPGHGLPMTRRQFEAYRAAFGSLLECASSDAAKSACIDGWMSGVGVLDSSDETFTRALMDYYVDVLRDPSKKSLCP